MKTTAILAKLRGTIELARHLIALGAADVPSGDGKSIAELIVDAQAALLDAEAHPSQRSLQRCVRRTLWLECRNSQILMQHLRLGELQSLCRLEVTATRNSTADVDRAAARASVDASSGVAAAAGYKLNS